MGKSLGLVFIMQSMVSMASTAQCGSVVGGGVFPIRYRLTELNSRSTLARWSVERMNRVIS